MKQCILACLVLLTTTGSWAQITLDSSDFGAIGQKTYIARDTVVVGGSAVSPAGAPAQSFDYSMLAFDYLDSIQFSNPAGSPAAGRFSSANLLLDEEGLLSYLIKTDTSVYMDGQFGDILDLGVTVAVDNDPYLQLISFPSTMGSAFAQTSTIDSTFEDIYTGIFDSLRLSSSRIVSSLIDAHGDLTTPGDVYSDVLRQYATLTANDTVYGFINGVGWQQVSVSSSTTYEYKWFAKSQGYWLLRVFTDAPYGNIVSTDFVVQGKPVPNVATQSVSCYGDTDGSLKVTNVLGGASPYTYRWSTGSTADSIVNLPPGSYTLTVYDQFDSSTTVLNITEPDSISIQSLQITDESLGNDGSLQITVSGGTGSPNYTYAWSNGATTRNISGLAAGAYTVTVTDANGCTQTATFTVGSNIGLNEREAYPIKVYPNPTTANLVIEAQQPLSEVRIVDVQGRVVKQLRVNQDRLNVDVSTLSSGTYWIQWYGKESSGGQWIEKH